MDTELEARAFAREEFPVKQNSTAVSLLAGSIGGASQVIVRFLLFDASLRFQSLACSAHARTTWLTGRATAVSLKRGEGSLWLSGSKRR